MGAPDLLQQLRGDGFSLGLTGDGRLSVAPARALTDSLRSAIRLHRDELATLLALHGTTEPKSQPERSSGNPLMTAEQGDACHAGGWNDDEIERFAARVMLFIRRGNSAQVADDLAERLTLRDRESDDRRVCAECEHYRPTRCSNARRAGLRVPEVSRELATLLQRCPGHRDAGPKHR